MTSKIDNLKRLYQACKHGLVDEVKTLYENNLITIDDFRENDNKRVKQAVKYGHLELIKYMHNVIGLEFKDFNGSEIYEKYDKNFQCLKYLHNYLDIGIIIVNRDK